MANKRTPQEKRDFREELTNQIVTLIEEGNAPWQKPWDPSKASQLMELPQNATTHRPYRGANMLHLMAKAQKMGVGDDPRWLTYKQAQDNGWQVRRGEKGTGIEYWKFDRQIEETNPDTGEKEKKTVKLDVPHAFYATVFHASQIDGIPAYIPQERGYDWNPAQEAENILTGSGANIYHDQQDRAFYRPSTDDIHLPPKEAFPEPVNYYETALHELSHWTGHEERLNRDLTGGFGSESYAREELRAEMASLYLSIETGVPFNPGQHGDMDISNTAAYTKSWVKVLKNDKNEIFKAAKDAEVIADYVIGLAKEKAINKIKENGITEPNINTTPEQTAAYGITQDISTAVSKTIDTILTTDANVQSNGITKEQLIAHLPKRRQEHNPDYTYALQKIGVTTVPGLRLADSEMAGVMALQLDQKIITIDQWAKYVDALHKENRVSIAKDTEPTIINSHTPTVRLEKQKQVTLDILKKKYNEMHFAFSKEHYVAIEKDIMKLQELDKNYTLQMLKEGSEIIDVRRTLEISSPFCGHDHELRKAYVDKIILEAQEKIIKQKVLTKIPVTSIYINRAEGPIGNTDHELTTSSFSIADAFLRDQAKTAPNYGYDKTDFKVTWQNGDIYEGTYDLQNIDRFRANMLETQIKEELEFYAGLYRPAHFKNAAWERHLSELDPKYVEERKEWLKNGEGLDVKPIALENVTTPKEAAQSFVPTPQKDQTLFISESYDQHITQFTEQYPGIAEAATLNERKDMRPLSESIAKTMLEDGHEPLAIIRCITENNPFLAERDEGYDAVRMAYYEISGESIAPVIQKAIEIEYKPDFIKAEQIRKDYFSKEDPSKYEYQRQVGLLHEKYRWEEIPVKITPAIDTKIAENMFKEGFTKDEAIHGIAKGSYHHNDDNYAKQIVSEVQIHSLYEQGKSNIEVAKELLTTQNYPKKEVTALLTKFAQDVPSRTDEARKFANAIIRTAEKEIKMSEPKKVVGIDR